MKKNSLTSRLPDFMLVFALVLSATFSQANERGLERKRSAPEAEDELKIAIVVGVDEYDHVSNLNYAEADAKALASVFKSQGYLVETILGFEALGTRILDRIREYEKLLESDDGEPQGSLVFTFSGHGFNNEQENFLATPDTDMHNLEETALRMSAVTQTLKDLNVRKRVLFIDACRNNPTASNRNAGDMSGTFIDDDSEAEGLAIMYSTAKGSLSWEDPSLGRGVFTHYLVEGLNGAAGGNLGRVSFDGLHKYVAGRVKRHVFESFREIQKPYKGGEWSGEFVLARHESEPVAETEQNLKAEDTVAIATVASDIENAETVEQPPQDDFVFVDAAANFDMVKDLFCKETDSEQGQTLKKQANAVFLGKYEYKGKRDEKRGWELYLDSLRYCSTAALMEISKTLAKRSRCDIAIEYAQLAADNGNKSAPRLVNQLSSRMAHSCES